ncbi:MAG: hypothetical protein AAF605_07875 [Myxococcota bacterium]
MHTKNQNAADERRQSVESPASLTITHERVARFRPWGVFELVLKILAFIILIPLWIYLLFADGDGGEDADEGGRRDDGDRRKRYRHSSFYTYHHEIVVRSYSSGEALLTESRTRVESPSHGEQVLATILADAAKQRLIVTEVVDVAPGKDGPVELSHRWYGGRPLMVPPGLRDAEGLLPELEAAGITIATAKNETILKRAAPPESFCYPFMVVGFFVLFLVGVSIGFTPLSLVLVIPVLIAAAIINRHDLGDLLFRMLCALLRIDHRFELRVVGTTVRFDHVQAWRRHHGTTEGSPLVAIGHGGGLGVEPGVDRSAPAVRVYGEKASVVIPPAAVEGAGPLVYEWLASTLLKQMPSTELHDFRSKCAYCGTLWDIEKADRCPSCGSPPLHGRAV